MGTQEGQVAGTLSRVTVTVCVAPAPLVSATVTVLPGVAELVAAWSASESVISWSPILLITSPGCRTCLSGGRVRLAR